MGYVSTNIAGTRLLIGGTDYSNELVSFNVSDDSIINSSIVQTTGDIVLLQSPNGRPVNDYTGTLFPIGSLVILDIKQPNGEYIRHPRGFLYVLQSSYDAQTKEMTLSVGCGLAVAIEFEDKTNDLAKNLINQFIPTDLINKLPHEQVLNINSTDNIEFNLGLFADCLKAQGKVVYQDKFGYIQLVDIFGSTGSYVTNPNSSYKFTSYDNETVISLTSQSDAQPVAGVKIQFSYTIKGRKNRAAIKGDADGSDDQDNFTPYETDNEFYLANSCKSDGTSKADPPQENQTSTVYEMRFNNNYEITDKDITEYDAENPFVDFGASPTFRTTRTTTTTRYYDGEGKQVSRETQKTSESNLVVAPSYFRDAVQVLIDSGYTRFEALSAIGTAIGYTTAERGEVNNYYGRGGEIVKKVETRYKPYITFVNNTYALAQFHLDPSKGGSFDSVFSERTETIITTTYKYFKEYNEEIVVTVEYDWDPYSRKETRSTRRSGNNNANPLQEDNFANTAGGGPAATVLDPVTNEYVVNPLDPEAPSLCTPRDESEEATDYEIVEGEDDQVNFEAGLSGLFTSGQFAPSGLQGGLNVPVLSANVLTENYPLTYRPLISKAGEIEYKKDVDNYARIVYRKAVADRLGFTVQESMRPEFYSWYPSYPFRLVVNSENKAFYLRVSAATWTLNNAEAVCSFESMLIGTFSYSSVIYPSFSQLNYLLPPIDVPTTSNKSIANHDATLGLTVRNVVVPGGPVSIPIAALPSITPTAIVPPFRLSVGIKSTVNTKLYVRLVTPSPVTTTPTPLAVTFTAKPALNVTALALNFGSITAPQGSTLNFGTVQNPSATNLELGSILNPAI